jgi:hypothetical protein
MVLDPLIEGRGQRSAIRRKGRSDAGLCHRADAGEAKAGNQAAGEEFAPIDLALAEQLLSCLLQYVFLFLAHGHFGSPSGLVESLHAPQRPNCLSNPATSQRLQFPCHVRSRMAARPLRQTAAMITSGATSGRR